MCFFWLIYLRSFEVSAWTFTSSIPLTFTLLQIWVGSLCSSRQAWNWDFWKMLICFCFLSVASGVASMELASCGILLRTIPINTFDPSQKTTFGAFYDVTSLYAGTMQKMMPRGNYRWNSEITVKQILETPESSNIGYFVEVDLKYPQHLHDLHNGLPLAPEKRSIRSSWLSPFAQSFGIKPNKTPKLIETLSELCVSLWKSQVFISDTGW